MGGRLRGTSRLYLSFVSDVYPLSFLCGGSICRFDQSLLFVVCIGRLYLPFLYIVLLYRFHLAVIFVVCIDLSLLFVVCSCRL